VAKLSTTPADSGSPPKVRGFFGTLFVGLLPVAIGIAIAAVIDRTIEHPFYEKVVTDIGIAIILAVSLNIVNGIAGQFSLGHAAFMTLGGYGAGLITYYGSLLMWNSASRHGGFAGPGEWLFFAGCIGGGLIATVAGYFVGLPSLRLKGDYLAIVTLGFGEILRVLFQQTEAVIKTRTELMNAPLSRLWPPPVGGAIGFDGLPKYTNLFWVYGFVTFMLVVAFRLKRSSLGRAMIAVREDEFAAQAMGVNVAYVKILAFMVAAFFAGVGGGLYAHEKGNMISPEAAGFQLSITYVLMTVLGGRGSISGVMLAAAILTILPEALRDFDQWRMIVYSLLLIAMMLFRPQGLFGIHEIWDWRPRWLFGAKNSRPISAAGGTNG
jgi:branched-chain amino acid transport system permease protein